MTHSHFAMVYFTSLTLLVIHPIDRDIKFGWLDGRLLWYVLVHTVSTTIG